MRALLMAILTSALLAGCGWQLRGGSNVSLEDRVLHVQSQVRGDLPAMVERSLRQAGAKTVDVPEQAEAVLVLVAENQQRRAASIDTNARVQEYRLEYRLSFRMESPEGELILPEQQLTVSQAYRYDSRNVLSSQSQETVVGERLRQDVVRLLLPRVGAALRAETVQ